MGSGISRTRGQALFGCLNEKTPLMYTNAGCMSLDWRLVCAPKRVATRVVAHELAYLKANNHSRQFWNLLSNICGKYEREHE